MSFTWRRSFTPPLVMVGLVAGTVALWKWSPEVPKWAQQNTGPWVLAAAVIAFTGVWLTIRAQGHNADNDRRERREEAERTHERGLEVAKDERDAQEARAQREWYREKQYEAFTAAVEATGSIFHAIPGLDSSLSERARIVLRFSSSVELAASLMPVESADSILTKANKITEGLDSSSAAEIGALAGSIRNVLYKEIQNLNNAGPNQRPHNKSRDSSLMTEQEAEGQ